MVPDLRFLISLHTRMAVDQLTVVMENAVHLTVI